MSNHFKDIGPHIEVFQTMEKAENVTGISADEMNSGHVKINQDIGKAMLYH
jgi:hypothetical protein